MSSSNLLSPIVNASYDTVLLAYLTIRKMLTGDDHIDFQGAFRNMSFKNKDEKYPKLVNMCDEEFYKVFEFTVPLGMSIEDFKKKEDVFAHILNTNVRDISFKKKEYNVLIKVRNSKRPNFTYDETIHKMKGFKIPVGVDLETMDIRYWDLEDPANSHAYLAGGTRCGKSTLLRLIMTCLVQKSAADVQFDLLNEKRVDLVEFKDCKNTVNYTEDVEHANTILLDVIEEMERRYTLFSRNRSIKNIWQYRSQIKKMPIRIVVVEEMASYVEDKEFHASLRKIASRGAGAGIFIICTSQLPNKDVVPNLTKQNINTTFGGKCKDRIRSEIIIEDGNLHKLKGKGHMKVFDSYEHGSEIQVLYIDDDKVDEITQNNLKRSMKKLN